MRKTVRTGRLVAVVTTALVATLLPGTALQAAVERIPAGTPAPGETTAPLVRTDLESAQWQIAGVGVDALASTEGYAADGRGVTVAVLADGVDDLHPDLTGVLVPGWDATTDKPYRLGGAHRFGAGASNGTFQAAVIAATADGAGLRGIAPGAKIMPIVVDGAKELDDGEVARGIRWATNSGAKVLTLSVGVSEGVTTDSTQATCAAISEARRSGALVFVPAVNDEVVGSTDYRPASCGDAVVISAVGENLTNRLDHQLVRTPDLAAPGYQILGATSGGDNLPYTVGSSTLWAATTAAAATAALWSARPELSAEEILDLLMRTATPLGDRAVYGAGLVDVSSALAGAPRNAQERRRILTERSVPTVVDANRGGDGRVALAWTPPFGTAVTGYRLEVTGWSPVTRRWVTSTSETDRNAVRAVLESELGSDRYVTVVALTDGGERRGAPVNNTWYNPARPRYDLDDSEAAVTDARVRWIPSGIEVIVTVNDPTRPWVLLVIDPKNGETVKRMETGAGTLRRVVPLSDRDGLRNQPLFIAAGMGRNGVDRLLLPQYGLKVSVLSAGKKHAGVYGTASCVSDDTIDCSSMDLREGTVLEVVDGQSRKVLARTVLRADYTFSAVWPHRPNTFDIVVRASGQQSMRLKGSFFVR